MPEEKFKRTDIWREGKWLDLWSAVHFLTGISAGLGGYFLHFGAIPSVIITLVSLICYEMWEAMVGIAETPTNRFMDVVVGMASFLPTFFFISPILTTRELVATFGLVLAINIAASILGWYESQKAAEREKRVLARYAKQRARLFKRKS